ncbi:MAG: AbrB/MazE/SpoVT family DNA-binding domain-containing protein [Candidatus Omnitrophota bacterium]
MTTSTITSKGQTTIPKEVREYLHLKAHDRLMYITEKNRIIIKPVTGTILDLKGAFPVKGKINFKKLREKMKKETAKRVIEEMG